MFKIITTLTMFALGLLAQAQGESPDSELFQTIKKADSLMFEETFNKCNFTLLEKIVHKDLQFLHDKGGIQNRDQFFKAMRENICGRPNAKPIRKLVDGSMQVYPLRDNGKLYGAIQMGIHEFYIAEPGKNLRKTGIAKFTDTWILENGDWKLYHVLSYDHQSAQ